MNDRVPDGLPLNLLAGVDQAKQHEIFNLGQSRGIESGATLFSEGDPALRCYCVTSGRLKLSKLHEEGKEAILRYIGPGEIAAAIAVFRGKNYPVTASAVRTTRVVSWDRATMMRIMQQYPPVAINMLRVVTERMEDIQRRYLELSAEQVEQRLARALLRIMKQSGRKTDQGILIDFRLSRQELADYTGTTLYTVSRTLSNWEKMGWVASGRERIVVTDAHALVAFAEAGLILSRSSAPFDCTRSPE